MSVFNRERASRLPSARPCQDRTGSPSHRPRWPDVHPRRPSLRAEPCVTTRARARTHAQESVVEAMDQDASPDGRGAQSIDLSPNSRTDRPQPAARPRRLPTLRRATATCPTLTAKEATTVGLSVDDVMDRRRVSPCLDGDHNILRVLQPRLQQCQSTHDSVAAYAHGTLNLDVLQEVRRTRARRPGLLGVPGLRTFRLHRLDQGGRGAPQPERAHGWGISTHGMADGSLRGSRVGVRKDVRGDKKPVDECC